MIDYTKEQDDNARKFDSGYCAICARKYAEDEKINFMRMLVKAATPYHIQFCHCDECGKYLNQMDDVSEWCGDIG